MKITYDADADAMYIYIVDRDVFKTKKINDNTLVDLDEEGNIIGMEILFVKKRMPDFLDEVELEKLA